MLRDASIHHLNFDCDGNCLAELDCNNECGGSAVLDECDICGGDGSTCTDITFDVLYESDIDIAGFQFNVDGAELLSASGGISESLGFTVSTGGQTVLGFSFTGDLIPAGSGVLTTLTLSGGSACLSDLVLSGADGLTIDGSEVLDCNTTIIPSQHRLVVQMSQLATLTQKLMEMMVRAYIMIVSVFVVVMLRKMSVVNVMGLESTVMDGKFIQMMQVLHMDVFGMFIRKM